MPSSDDRFARQNRYGPPSGFPLTSTWPGIVHHLSGPNVWALGPRLSSAQKSKPADGVARGCAAATSDDGSPLVPSDDTSLSLRV